MSYRKVTVKVVSEVTVMIDDDADLDEVMEGLEMTLDSDKADIVDFGIEDAEVTDSR